MLFTSKTQGSATRCPFSPLVAFGYRHPPSLDLISTRTRRLSVAAAGAAKTADNQSSDPAWPLIPWSDGPAPRRVLDPRGRFWQSLRTHFVFQRLTRRYPCLSTATDPSFWGLCFRDSRPPWHPSSEGIILPLPHGNSSRKECVVNGQMTQASKK